eukprot:TRINITY_DN36934_c0_g1_i3.p1 TRINITY_DN36934_c0_g1~~TRINITY_DN36934_c0_g1_i3.p1  ORF type:complete len:2811 (-),score=816.92 TRINITY_DN36934_c0_g1_i3:100-8499(-)
MNEMKKIERTSLKLIEKECQRIETCEVSLNDDFCEHIQDVLHKEVIGSDNDDVNDIIEVKLVSRNDHANNSNKKVSRSIRDCGVFEIDSDTHLKVTVDSSKLEVPIEDAKSKIQTFMNMVVPTFRASLNVARTSQELSSNQESLSSVGNTIYVLSLIMNSRSLDELTNSLRNVSLNLHSFDFNTYELSTFEKSNEEISKSSMKTHLFDSETLQIDGYLECCFDGVFKAESSVLESVNEECFKELESLLGLFEIPSSDLDILYLCDVDSNATSLLVFPAETLSIESRNQLVHAINTKLRLWSAQKIQDDIHKTKNEQKKCMQQLELTMLTERLTTNLVSSALTGSDINSIVLRKSSAFDQLDSAVNTSFDGVDIGFESDVSSRLILTCTSSRLHNFNRRRQVFTTRNTETGLNEETTLAESDILGSAFTTQSYAHSISSEYPNITMHWFPMGSGVLELWVSATFENETTIPIEEQFTSSQLMFAEEIQAIVIPSLSSLLDYSLSFDRISSGLNVPTLRQSCLQLVQLENTLTRMDKVLANGDLSDLQKIGTSCLLPSFPDDGSIEIISVDVNHRNNDSSLSVENNSNNNKVTCKITIVNGSTDEASSVMMPISLIVSSTISVELAFKLNNLPKTTAQDFTTQHKWNISLFVRELIRKFEENKNTQKNSEIEDLEFALLDCNKKYKKSKKLLDGLMALNSISTGCLTVDSSSNNSNDHLNTTAENLKNLLQGMQTSVKELSDTPVPLKMKSTNMSNFSTKERFASMIQNMEIELQQKMLFEYGSSVRIWSVIGNDKSVVVNGDGDRYRVNDKPMIFRVIHGDEQIVKIPGSLLVKLGSVGVLVIDTEKEIQTSLLTMIAKQLTLTLQASHFSCGLIESNLNSIFDSKIPFSITKMQLVFSEEVITWMKHLLPSPSVDLLKSDESHLHSLIENLLESIKENDDLLSIISHSMRKNGKNGCPIDMSSLNTMVWKHSDKSSDSSFVDSSTMSLLWNSDQLVSNVIFSRSMDIFKEAISELNNQYWPSVMFIVPKSKSVTDIHVLAAIRDSEELPVSFVHSIVPISHSTDDGEKLRSVYKSLGVSPIRNIKEELNTLGLGRKLADLIEGVSGMLQSICDGVVSVSQENYNLQRSERKNAMLFDKLLEVSAAMTRSVSSVSSPSEIRKCINSELPNLMKYLGSSLGASSASLFVLDNEKQCYNLIGEGNVSIGIDVLSTYQVTNHNGVSSLKKRNDMFSPRTIRVHISSNDGTNALWRNGDLLFVYPLMSLSSTVGDSTQSTDVNKERQKSVLGQFVIHFSKECEEQESINNEGVAARIFRIMNLLSGHIVPLIVSGNSIAGLNNEFVSRYTDFMSSQLSSQHKKSIQQTCFQNWRNNVLNSKLERLENSTATVNESLENYRSEVEATRVLNDIIIALGSTSLSLEGSSEEFEGISLDNRIQKLICGPLAEVLNVDSIGVILPGEDSYELFERGNLTTFTTGYGCVHSCVDILTIPRSNDNIITIPSLLNADEFDESYDLLGYGDMIEENNTTKKDWTVAYVRLCVRSLSNSPIILRLSSLRSNTPEADIPPIGVLSALSERMGELISYLIKTQQNETSLINRCNDLYLELQSLQTSLNSSEGHVTTASDCNDAIFSLYNSGVEDSIDDNSFLEFASELMRKTFHCDQCALFTASSPSFSQSMTSSPCLARTHAFSSGCATLEDNTLCDVDLDMDMGDNDLNRFKELCYPVSIDEQNEVLLYIWLRDSKSTDGMFADQMMKPAVRLMTLIGVLLKHRRCQSGRVASVVDMENRIAELSSTLEHSSMERHEQGILLDKHAVLASCVAAINDKSVREEATDIILDHISKVVASSINTRIYVSSQLGENQVRVLEYKSNDSSPVSDEPMSQLLLQAITNEQVTAGVTSADTVSCFMPLARSDSGDSENKSRYWIRIDWNTEELPEAMVSATHSVLTGSLSEICPKKWLMREFLALLGEHLVKDIKSKTTHMELTQTRQSLNTLRHKHSLAAELLSFETRHEAMTVNRKIRRLLCAQLHVCVDLKVFVVLSGGRLLDCTHGKVLSAETKCFALNALKSHDSITQDIWQGKANDDIYISNIDLLSHAAKSNPEKLTAIPLGVSSDSGIVLEVLGADGNFPDVLEQWKGMIVALATSTVAVTPSCWIDASASNTKHVLNSMIKCSTDGSLEECLQTFAGISPLVKSIVPFRFFSGHLYPLNSESAIQVSSAVSISLSRNESCYDPFTMSSARNNSTLGSSTSTKEVKGLFVCCRSIGGGNIVLRFEINMDLPFTTGNSLNSLSQCSTIFNSLPFLEICIDRFITDRTHNNQQQQQNFTTPFSPQLMTSARNNAKYGDSSPIMSDVSLGRAQIPNQNTANVDLRMPWEWISNWSLCVDIMKDSMKTSNRNEMMKGLLRALKTCIFSKTHFVRILEVNASSSIVTDIASNQTIPLSENCLLRSVSRSNNALHVSDVKMNGGFDGTVDGLNDQFWSVYEHAGGSAGFKVSMDFCPLVPFSSSSSSTNSFMTSTSAISNTNSPSSIILAISYMNQNSTALMSSRNSIGDNLSKKISMATIIASLMISTCGSSNVSNENNTKKHVSFDNMNSVVKSSSSHITCERCGKTISDLIETNAHKEHQLHDQILSLQRECSLLKKELKKSSSNGSSLKERSNLHLKLRAAEVQVKDYKERFQSLKKEHASIVHRLKNKLRIAQETDHRHHRTHDRHIPIVVEDHSDCQAKLNQLSDRLRVRERETLSLNNEMMDLRLIKTEAVLLGKAVSVIISCGNHSVMGQKALKQAQEICDSWESNHLL